MTKAIHKMQREAETLTGLIREKKQEVVTRKHHAVQRMLKNLAVVNPYAEYLSYPNHSFEQNNVTLDDIFFTRRMIREYTGWTDWQVKSHIKQLEELEYLVARTGTKGKEYSYVLNYNGQGEQEEKCYLNLTTVKEIQRNLESALTWRDKKGLGGQLETPGGYLVGI